MGAPRAEPVVQFYNGTDSNHSIWFIAPAKEQLALTADWMSHVISFGCVLNKSGGRRPKCSDLGDADPVFETGAASLYLPAFHKRIGCSGWNRTSTVPLNKRVDYYYPTEQ